MKQLDNYLSDNVTKSIVTEGIRNIDIDNTLNKVQEFLKKRRIYTIPSIESANVDGTQGFITYCFTDNNMGCAFVWKRDDTTQIDSILFTDDFGNTYADTIKMTDVKWKSYVTLKGASITRSLQLVADVLNKRIGMDRASLNKSIRDAQVWESADPTIAEIEKRKSSIYHKIKNMTLKGADAVDIQDLQDQYDNIKNELADARISVKQNVPVTPVPDIHLNNILKQFKERINSGDSVIDVIGGLSRNIMPDLLTPMSKEKALGYIRKNVSHTLNMIDFILTAKLFLSNAPSKTIEKLLSQVVKA